MSRSGSAYTCLSRLFSGLTGVINPNSGDGCLLGIGQLSSSISEAPRAMVTSETGRNASTLCDEASRPLFDDARVLRETFLPVT